MAADQFLWKAISINPVVGRFVVGGGMVIALAALAVTWFEDRWYADRQSVVYAVAGVLAACVLAALLVALLPTRGDLRWPRVVVGWSAMLLVVAYPWTLFFSIVVPDWPRPFTCLTQPWQPCPSAIAAAAQRNALFSPPPSPAAQPETQQSPARTVDRGAYLVKLMFAGGINREREIIPLSRALIDRGWTRLPGFRGNRTEAADGEAEVRYGRHSDDAAAKALAEDVARSIPLGRPVMPVLDSLIAPGELEIWISR